ncbi:MULTISPECIES: hypothetical protein [Streptomyces]|uniref:hypothetical protein n=1 Tax=Streptomyces TaxID=1883 RepID=UPI001E5D7515|nr:MULTISPECIES: hypothetical protein [Streptomyces]UFQ16982.1 hypothetical protein J2N69_19340 [Streptomyces huasconensis]WCL86584.1 hypothetical protein PPN52_19345 [Streptomyces sp. JCM 35825]
MRVTRRTFRTAAVATGAVAATGALAAFAVVPAAAASAAERPKPAGVTADAPDEVPLMAAGGGMAALGAAGLGRAVHRRRHDD